MNSIRGRRFNLRPKRVFSEEEVYYKGEDEEYEIDLDDLEEKISSLKNVCDEQVSLLKSPHDVNFEHVKNIVYLLKNHSSYDRVYDIAKKYFSDVKNVLPGSVSAYFVGCDMVQKNPDDKYKVICSNDSLKKRGNSWNSFDKTVIHGLYNDRLSQFNFFPINISKNRTTVVICMKYKTYSDFPGFSEAEKDFLSEMFGADEVVLISYDTSKGYIELNEGAIPMSELKTRKGDKRMGRDLQISSKNTSLDDKVIIIGVVMIIMIIVLAYMMRKK